MAITFQTEDCSVWTVSTALKSLKTNIAYNIICSLVCTMYLLFQHSSQIPDFESSILEIFTNHSSFPTQGASFINSSLTCSSSSYLTFSSTLIYSSDSGLLIASDLIDLMEAQIISGRGATTITVKGVELPIHQVRDGVQDMNVSPSSSPLLIAFFFGGVGTSSFIWLTVVIVVKV